MRESIGTSFMLNFIVIFLVFVFAFLAATLSYYRAYRVNNAIIHSIEKFEGYNAKSKKEIIDKLNTLGYEIHEIECSETFKSKSVNFGDSAGKLLSENADGYCVYLYFNDQAAPSAADASKKSTTDIYYTIGVATYMRIEFPVIGALIKLPIFSKTYNIYYFPEWGTDETTVVSKVNTELEKFVYPTT